MPWGDRTGPMGLGPMTGRGAGYCAGSPSPGYANPWYGGFGWGRGGGGRGRGRGFGFRRGFHPYGLPGYGYAPFASPYGAPPPSYGVPQSAEEEAEFLKGQLDLLQKEIQEINSRIRELESEKKTKR